MKGFHEGFLFWSGFYSIICVHVNIANEFVYIDFSIMVISLIQVLIIFEVCRLHAQRGNWIFIFLHTWQALVSWFPITASLLHRGLWRLFFTAQTVAYSRLSTVKCQHHVVDMECVSCNLFPTVIQRSAFSCQLMSKLSIILNFFNHWNTHK